MKQFAFAVSNGIETHPAIRESERKTGPGDLKMKEMLISDFPVRRPSTVRYRRVEDRITLLILAISPA
jgi:hypothetical protein